VHIGIAVDKRTTDILVEVNGIRATTEEDVKVAIIVDVEGPYAIVVGRIGGIAAKGGKLKITTVVDV